VVDGDDSGVFSFLRAVTRVSLISIKSSSSLPKAAPSEREPPLSGRDHVPLGSTVTWSVSLGVFLMISLKYLGFVSLRLLKDRGKAYSSTAKVSKGAGLSHSGQSQVGPCSCICRYDVASKHWMCLQDTERQGRSILSVESGHFKDKTIDVSSTSRSRALLTTLSKRCQLYSNTTELLVSSNSTYSP
jgi:hypothetical protein